MEDRQIVWTICFYLCAVYILFGFLCFLVWQRSALLEVIGWSWGNPGAENLQKIIYSSCAGALGAISYSFWKLFHHYCSNDTFDSKWTIWYIFGPVSGSLLGIAAYAVVLGGLLVLGESITLRSNWAIFALSFLTGFSAKRVLRKLHAIAGQIFQAAKMPPRTKPCSNCGAKVEVKAKYCPSCGNKMKSEDKTESPGTSRARSAKNEGVQKDA